MRDALARYARPDKGLVLRLPEALRVTTLVGTVVWPDGRPAAGANIYLREPGSVRQRETGVTADAYGRFTIQVPIGESYSVRAYADVTDERGGREQRPATPVTVKATAKPEPLRLVVSLSRSR